ncbi:MAG TPA: MFS transporter [Acidimicrobiales bacterium]|nr:MFS transporter [Acidimicrobiales bacterium]
MTARPRAAAIAALFVANGLGAPSFLPRLPERRAELGLSDAGLGVVLAGLALGALVASPVAGRLVGRAGSGRVAVAAALALAAALWTAGAAPTPALLFAALALVGAADAAMDIAMNANGAAYERGAGRSLLHRLHGAWSLGAVAGAGLAAGAAARGVGLTAQLVAVGAFIAAAGLAARPGLVPPAAERASLPPPPSEPAGPGRWRRPFGPLAALAAATVGGALLEGAPADWSALRLTRLGLGAGAAALGFAVFMTGMLAGRLVGDRLTDRHGAVPVLRGGMALVVAGLALGVAVDHPAAFAAGLALAGLGTSPFFPLAFSAAGSTPGVAPGAGAAVVSLAARLGFLAEPLLVGALAELAGLRWAFLAVAATALALAAAAPRIVPQSRVASPPSTGMTVPVR